MRPLLALLLSVGLMGGTAVYLDFARRVRPPVVTAIVKQSQDKVRVIIQRTFDAVPDPLAELDALDVRLEGRSVFLSQEPVSQDESIEFDIEEGLKQGPNEITIIANRDFLETSLAAMHVEVLLDGKSIASATLVNEPDLPEISGSVVFDLPLREEPSPDHEHGEGH